MIKVLIVDDEELARRKVVSMLRKVYFPPHIIQEALDGPSAVFAIREFSPDLVFLDIEMPGFSGFHVLQNLGYRSFKIIFQTAYDSYAVRAFEEHACDYLLKPFSEQRFQIAVSRALADLNISKKLQELELGLVKSKLYMDRFVVKQGDAKKIFLANQVNCFVSREHYTYLYPQSGEYILDLSLIQLMRRVDPEQFIQVHRKSAVRKEAIVEIKTGNPSFVVLQNGMRLEISRRHRAGVEEFVASDKLFTSLRI